MTMIAMNTLHRAIKDLANAGIIDYEETPTTTNATTASIVTHAEAHIMTRNLIKFPTMELITKISGHATIAQVTVKTQIQLQYSVYITSHFSCPAINCITFYRV